MASRSRSPATNTALTQGDIDWILSLLGDTNANVGSLVSGVAEARAKAEAAQATGDANSTSINNTNTQLASSGTVPGFEMAAVASPTSVSRLVPISGSETTGTVTVTPTGGVAPYTYAWTFQIGDTTLTVDSPSSAATTFTGSVNQGESISDTAQCVVTDSTGGTPLTAAAYVAVSISSLG